MNTKALVKLDRLLRRFPECWVHTQETAEVYGVTKTFHHVDYKSDVAGRPRVRLVSHVSADMCELLVELKANAADLIAAARAFENRETSKPGKTQKLNKSNRRNPNA